jgi:hypothetical protein
MSTAADVNMTSIHLTPYREKEERESARERNMINFNNIRNVYTADLDIIINIKIYGILSIFNTFRFSSIANEIFVC